MYPINRFDVVTEVETLVSNLCPKKDLGEVALTLYFELLDIVVYALNDPANIQLFDRVEKEFRYREVPHTLQLTLIEFVTHLAEQVRSHYIRLETPRFVKYKSKLVPKEKMVGTDRIIVDYEATALSITTSTEIPEEDFSLYPTLDELNNVFDEIPGNKKNSS